MKLDVYVNYRGTCEAAFRFYEDQLGGRITGMVRHGQQPNPNIPADWHDKILDAHIESAARLRLPIASRCSATSSDAPGCCSSTPRCDKSGGSHQAAACKTWKKLLTSLFSCAAFSSP